MSLLKRVLALLHGSLTLMTSFNFVTSSIGPTVTLGVGVSMQEFGGGGGDTIRYIIPPRLIRTDITIIWEQGQLCSLQNQGNSSTLGTGAAVIL